MRHQRVARAIERALFSGRPRRQVSCGKTRFVDRIAADLALAGIRAHGRVRGREPVRSYCCPRCHGWHLTSTSPRRNHDAPPKVTRRH